MTTALVQSYWFKYATYYGALKHLMKANMVFYCKNQESIYQWEKMGVVLESDVVISNKGGLSLNGQYSYTCRRN